MMTMMTFEVALVSSSEGLRERSRTLGLISMVGFYTVHILYLHDMNSWRSALDSIPGHIRLLSRTLLLGTFPDQKPCCQPACGFECSFSMYELASITRDSA